MKSYELQIKKIKSSELDSKPVNSSNDAYEFARNFYSDDIEIYESIFMIVMNQANNPIGWSKISQGGTCASTFDVKIMCKIAIDSLAEQVILVHNHPSGSITPSESDIKVTRQAKKALEILDIRLTDHLIMTKSAYYSFSDNGFL